MRTIITGGTGTIGRALSASLTADGHEVIALSRTPEKATGLAQGVRVVGWDARSAAGWGELAEGADAIVNLAGENLAGAGLIPNRWTAKRKREIEASRINAGKAVLEAVDRATRKPRVVIQSSAVGYYGHRGDETITESASPGADFLAQLCVKWEAATAPVEAMGVRQVVIRSAVVLDPQEGALQRLMLPYRLFVGVWFGSGKQWLSWIHPQDEVGAIRFLIEHDEAHGPFNLSAPNPLTNRDFCKTLGEVLGRPTLLPAPAFAMRLVLGEVADTVLEGQRTLPERLQYLGFSFRFPEAEAALRDLLDRR